MLNLLGLSPAKISDFLQGHGARPFHSQQILQWMHQRQVRDFDAMTDLSKALRTKLKEIACIQLPKIARMQFSDDGTRKWLLELEDGNQIETVLIPDGGRNTLCVSSQVGCVLDCQFCATGKQGFNRDLTTAEIIGQLWLVQHALQQERSCRENKDVVRVQPVAKIITNVVFMGMGEPLLNFEQVMSAIDLMFHDHAYGLSKRRVTVSTAGVAPAMEQMIGRTQASLALSLHAPDDALRSRIVPINKKYPIQVILEKVRSYLASLPDKRAVTIEYTMIKDVNDQEHQARNLIKLLRSLPCKINLIPFNPFPQSTYQCSDTARIRQFAHLLKQAGYVVTVRSTRGDDIAAACGQLVGVVEDRTRRQVTWRKAALQSSGS